MLKAVVLGGMLVGCGRLGFGDNGDRDAALDGSNAQDAGDATGMMVQQTQMTAVSSDVGSQTLTLPAPSTAGSLLVIAFGANSTSSLSLPSGWQVATQTLTSGACAAAIAYLPGNPGGISDVMFMQPSLQPTVAQLTEWRGVTSLDAIGTTMGAVAVTAQSVQTTTATAVSNELAITVFCEDVNMPAYTSDVTWTNLGRATNGPSSPSYVSDYRLVAAPGTVSETVTSSLTGKYAAAIATFRPQ